MNKKLLFMAVAGALALPSISLAAIDDAGMKYVSASEGLSGSVRIRFLTDNDDDNVDPQTNFDRSRIIYNGSSDLGGGMAATYYFEFRPTPKLGNNDDQFRIKFLDAGLKGPFGHVRVGEIETVSESVLPNADRGNDAGTSGDSLVEEYERGLRWVSPDINGLVLGAGVQMIDDEDNEDDSVDAWDLVASYELPMGLALGGSYAAISATEEGKEDEEGFRLGAEYEQDNWGIAYNFHSYKAYDKNVGIEGGSPTAADASAFAAVTLNAAGHEDTEYVEHVIGANVSVNRFNFAFTYSTAEVQNDKIDTDSAAGTNNVSTVNAEFKEATVDVAYKLGSKAKVVAAYETNEQSGVGVEDEEKKGWYLLYRVDF